jgi:hypothetical protein
VPPFVRVCIFFFFFFFFSFFFFFFFLLGVYLRAHIAFCVGIDTIEYYEYTKCHILFALASEFEANVITLRNPRSTKIHVQTIKKKKKK